MDVDLKKRSEEIHKSFASLLSELEQTKTERLSAYAKAVEEYQVAAAQGDHRENAAYEEAVKKMASISGEITKLTERIGKVQNCSKRSYTPIGMVVLYSTVHFRCEKTGREFIYCVYPEGISDLSRNIIRRDSRLGIALWLKKAGDVFVIDPRLTKETLKYTILGVY